MKTLIFLIVFGVLAGSAFAQLSTVPPSSIADGIVLRSMGVNSGTTKWEAAPGLASYKFGSDATLDAPKPGAPDNVLGLNWASSSAQAQSQRDMVNSKGGIIRAIFIGESAGWLNDFGYTYTGNPQGPDSFTILSNIQANPGSPYGVNVNYGDHVDITLGVGQASKLDFWLNGVGGDGTANPATPTDFGGVYTAFNPANSSPYNTPGNVMWTTEALGVSTYIPAYVNKFGELVAAHYEMVDTFLVSFEDWRTDKGADLDYNDCMFALQFFTVDGQADANVMASVMVAVPEPSTYGLFCAAALIGLVIVRRFKFKASN